jgi:hypothetical protein
MLSKCIFIDNSRININPSGKFESDDKDFDVGYSKILKFGISRYCKKIFFLLT